LPETDDTLDLEGEGGSLHAVMRVTRSDLRMLLRSEIPRDHPPWVLELAAVQAATIAPVDTTESA